MHTCMHISIDRMEEALLCAWGDTHTFSRTICGAYSMVHSLWWTAVVDNVVAGLG